MALNCFSAIHVPMDYLDSFSVHEYSRGLLVVLLPCKNTLVLSLTRLCNLSSPKGEELGFSTSLDHTALHRLGLLGSGPELAPLP